MAKAAGTMGRKRQAFKLLRPWADKDRDAAIALVRLTDDPTLLQEAWDALARQAEVHPQAAIVLAEAASGVDESDRAKSLLWGHAQLDRDAAIKVAELAEGEEELKQARDLLRMHAPLHPEAAIALMKLSNEREPVQEAWSLLRPHAGRSDAAAIILVKRAPSESHRLDALEILAKRSASQPGTAEALLGLAARDDERDRAVRYLESHAVTDAGAAATLAVYRAQHEDVVDARACLAPFLADNNTRFTVFYRVVTLTLDANLLAELFPVEEPQHLELRRFLRQRARRNFWREASLWGWLVARNGEILPSERRDVTRALKDRYADSHPAAACALAELAQRRTERRSALELVLSHSEDAQLQPERRFWPLRWSWRLAEELNDASSKARIRRALSALEGLPEDLAELARGPDA